MKTNVFDYSSYKTYLKAAIGAQPNAGRGFKAKLADAIGCQRTFVSQVLQDDAHFNLEHGERINSCLGHSNEEAHFFLLLIQFERAGTEGLRDYFQAQMKKVLDARLVLRSRIKTEVELSIELQRKYYKTWYYSAVCIALTIEKLRTREALAKRLLLPNKKLLEVLEFLQSAGLIEQRGDQYFPTKRHLHLGNDSDLAAYHHTAWRVRTIQSLEQEGPRDLHYSTIVSLSEKDAQELKSLSVDFIDRLQKKVAPSPEETLRVLCLDFFEI